MENPGQEAGTEINPTRPNLLTVLCILTFVGSGLNLFSSLMISLFFDTFKTVTASIAKSMSLTGMEVILGADRMFFVVSSLFYASAIAGAVLMFRMKKTGFHVYTISQIMLIMTSMFFFKLPGSSVFLDVAISGVFVALYSYNLKLMA